MKRKLGTVRCTACSQIIDYGYCYSVETHTITLQDHRVANGGERCQHAGLSIIDHNISLWIAEKLYPDLLQSIQCAPARDGMTSVESRSQPKAGAGALPTESQEDSPLCPDSPDGNHHCVPIGCAEEEYHSADCYYCGEKPTVIALGAEDKEVLRG